MSEPSIAVIDIETDLAHEIIWCVSITDKDSTTLYVDESDLGLVEGSKPFAEMPDPSAYDEWWAHYGTRFDFPKLAEILGWDCPKHKQRDSWLLMQIYRHPKLTQYGLADLARAAGKRLKTGFKKEDFDLGFTTEMGLYCMDDTKANWDGVMWLLRELGKMRSDRSLKFLVIEQEVLRLTDWQKAKGFRIDFDRTTELYETLMAECHAITLTLQKVFPPIVTERYSEKLIDKATGKPKRLKDHVETFNPGSRQQIARRLETLGAKWTKFTEVTENGNGGNVVIDEVTLGEWADTIPEAALCLEYFTLNKRRSQVESWLAKMDDEHRIHGSVNTVGAVTSRMTHSNPNLGQVEKGPETRGCFIASDGRVNVGADASGLELRMLAHYMNDPAYTHELLQGDIHSINQEAAGLETRDQAKTFIYAFLYGAGDEKIGSIVDPNASKRKKQNIGASLKEQFLANTPALKDLRDKIGRMAKQGHLPALDGRRLRVRHQHAALNTLLQGAGAQVMKVGLVEAVRFADENGIIRDVDWNLVCQVHDEYQTECIPDKADLLGQCLVEGIRSAGEWLECRCPLDGEYMIGNSWAETH